MFKYCSLPLGNNQHKIVSTHTQYIVGQGHTDPHTEGPEEIITNKDFNSVFQEKAWNKIICGQKQKM